MNATASRTLRNIIIRFPWLRPRCGARCTACPMWESKPQTITNEKSAVRQSHRARKKNNDRHGAWSKATNPDKTGSAEEGRGLPRGSICARRVSTPSGLHLMRRQHRLAFRREDGPVRYETVLKRLVPSAPRNFVTELAHVRTTGGLLLRRSHLSR